LEHIVKLLLDACIAKNLACSESGCDHSHFGFMLLNLLIDKPLQQNVNIVSFLDILLNDCALRWEMDHFTRLNQLLPHVRI
jgi:hypothetical protein